MLFVPPVPLGGHVQQICGHIAGFHTLPIHVRGMEHVRPRQNGNALCGAAAHSHPDIGSGLVVREHNACLNIITALRYIREDLPKTMEELEKLLAGLDESGFHKA